jgi:hypothetical protein
MAEALPAKPIEDVRDISAITYGFMASKALFAALDFDLFTHVDRGADSVIGLAKATGVSENLLSTLLTALQSLGLIVEREGRFVNAPATAKFLVAGAPGDFRDDVRLVNGAFGYESFRHLMFDQGQKMSVCLFTMAQLYYCLDRKPMRRGSESRLSVLVALL